MKGIRKSSKMVTEIQQNEYANIARGMKGIENPAKGVEKYITKEKDY